MILKYLYGLDSLERHRGVAQLIREVDPPIVDLLDVGGEASIRCNHLGRFLRGPSIVTANVGRQSDVTYEGTKLPFPDDAFDGVVSLDTAEHVPREARASWIGEFFRVARRQVVICAPLATDYQVRAERELNDLHIDLFGCAHHYLAEHIACTLPTVDELLSWADGRPCKLVFDGDARVFARHLATLFRLVRYGGVFGRPAKILHQFYTLSSLRPLDLRSEPGPWTRRAYLSVDVSGDRTR